MKVVGVQEVVTRAICYSSLDKVCNLRPDSLAQILAFSNVYAGAKAMVFDSCMGVVLGAVTERLGGHGRVLAAYAGSHPACDAMQRFNFAPAVEATVCHFHTTEIGKLGETAGEELPDESPEAVEALARKVIAEIPDFLAKKMGSFKSEAEKDAYMATRAARIRRQCAKPKPATVRHWLRGQSDSLIIATHFHPTAVLLQLWPTLAAAAPFVIFCEYVEPLVQCFREVQKRQLACKLQLSETWTREFQVLPGRTHPAMTTSSSSGFVLTGVKVGKRDDGWHFVEKVKETKRPKPDGSSANR
jgi:tRNA (adenine-N(1)-)-methyltransferase non-catalytic subunit